MSVALTLVSGTQKPAKAGGRQLAGIAVCRDRDQLVYGATCTWQLSSTDVSIDWQRPVTNLADSVTGEDSAFHLGKAGSYTATCTIGAAQLDVPLRR
jgi:hypothetical protein